jgi:acetoin utilization deacetylase AcuC-like enzyme
MVDASTIPVFWHRAMLAHEPPEGTFKFPDVEFLAEPEPHPERPERIENVRSTIEHLLGERAPFRDARPATRAELAAVHAPDHVDRVEAFAAGGGGRIEDTTTGGNEHTFEAARYAAGAATQAALEAVRTPADTVPYALVRPPGHHAQPAQADGFCFFNNVAVAAEATLASTDVDSVAIVDWDVHHGNGTQEIFYDRDDVLLLSVHHDHGSWHPEFHPQEGSIAEVGTGPGEGYTVNVPTPVGTGNEGYASIFDAVVDPVLADYRPDLILVCAGQDAGVADPNARNLVDRAGFRTMARKVSGYADRHTDGALAVVQEGGYQPSHLAFATLGVLEGFLGTTVDLSAYGVDDGDPFAWLEELRAPVDERIGAVRDRYSEYWPSL